MVGDITLNCHELRLDNGKILCCVRSAFSDSPANTHVARAKTAILQKKRTLGSGSSERTVNRQPFEVSEVAGRIPTTTAVPSFVAPMQAMLVDSIRPGDWIYEIKFDGYRAVALRSGNETRILSRNDKDLARKFPEVKDAVAALAVQDAVIDGEIVALDDKGRSSFQLLQGFDMGLARPNRKKRKKRPTVKLALADVPDCDRLFSLPPGCEHHATVWHVAQRRSLMIELVHDRRLEFQHPAAASDP
jgi:ATP-dependent DNA ligase